jgi:moderate conductance mechanosensitive channel
MEGEMDFRAIINDLLANERLLANLIGIHVVLGVLLLLSVVLRKTFKHGTDRLIRWTELHWLHRVHKHAHRGLRQVLFWMTLLLMLVACVVTAIYHHTGQDIRADLRDWYAQLGRSHIVAAAVIVGRVVAVIVVAVIAFRVVRRLSAILEASVRSYLPRQMPDSEVAAARTERSLPDQRINYEQTLRRWFFLFERFAMAAVLLGGVWIAGRFAELPRLADVAALLLRILTILTVARLLTLSCRTLSFAVATLGERHLGRGKFQRYWERVARLIPFGERCFEAAVYIAAASMCVRELEFIAFVASYGAKIVKCIGLFFGTRVVIELLSVFVNEAFGMYEEDRPMDQKGLTLVPLLQSFSQYALYFGSGLFMLRVFEVDTTPILAGAGIVGLAGGLGAQSLVTDVVSGFFILFENWYLVGDIVQIGDSVGRVEAVSIRHTQVRDEQGKLFIIPNGQIKTVTNFSKGYVNAVVDIKVPATTNLANIMRDMAEAGRRLRQTRHEVLAETIIKGLVDLTPADMVIRAVTKVQPGTHLMMQQEYRRLLKEVFDEGQPAGPKAMAA